jgi:hypothetical protein
MFPAVLHRDPLQMHVLLLAGLGVLWEVDLGQGLTDSVRGHRHLIEARQECQILMRPA